MGHYFINDDKLISDIKEYQVKIENTIFKFKTDNGVFSKGELDFGTELLIKTVLKENIFGSILDLGCGYGVIGIVLNKLRNIKVDSIDINKRAVHLTKLNIKNNECSNINCYESDGCNNVKNKYNFIISNPPIRVGKKILYEILVGAKEHLNNNGHLIFVMNKDQGAKSTMEYMKNYYNVNLICKNKGFYVIDCQNY